MHCTNPHCPRPSKIFAPDKRNALIFSCKKCQAFEGKIRTVLSQGNKKMTASSLLCAGTTSKDFTWDWTCSLWFSGLGLTTNFFFACSRQRPQKRMINFKHQSFGPSLLQPMSWETAWSKQSQKDSSHLEIRSHGFSGTQRSTSWEGHSAQ